MKRGLGVTVLLALLAAAPAHGQEGRAKFISGGLEAYDNFQPDRALQLLSLGVDPSLGALDSLWGIGVQNLVQILLEQRQDSLAALWARWALRQAPAFVVDSVNFLPSVTETFQRARRSPADPRDLVVETTWRWAAAPDLRAPGSVRAVPGRSDTKVRLLVVGFGVVQAGDSLALAPGSYRFEASADGYLSAEVTREVLPGVPTMLAFDLLPAEAGFLSVASRPWGVVFLDGQRVGESPIVERRLTAGAHRVRVEREGAAPVDTTVQVVRDARVRLALGAPAQPAAGAADAGLAAVLAAYDAADVAGGVAAARTVLAALPDTARGRGRAQMYLAAGRWWLGERDSAAATMRAAVATDPFVQLDAERFNPELAAALTAARREVAVLGVRAPAEVVVRPDSGAWALDVAVGRPGTVRVRWRGAGRDSVLATSPVDSSATLRIPLANAAGVVVAPGPGDVSLELMEGARQLAARRITVAVEAVPVDTARHEPALQPVDFRVESRRGNISVPGLLRGLAVAAAAAALPMVVANSSLPGATVQRGALVAGGTLALGSLIGALAGRPATPIAENIEYNRQLRESWDARDRAIAASNEYRRRFAPLRIRAAVAP